MQFDGSGSSDPDPGDVLAYSWDLDGNGTFGDSTAVAPSRTYTSAGTYKPKLRVTDPHGATAVATVTITAGNTRPNATIITPSGSTTWARRQRHQLLRLRDRSAAGHARLVGAHVDARAAPLSVELPRAHGADLPRRVRLVHRPRARVPDPPRAAASPRPMPGGLTDTKSVFLYPETVDLTLATDPPGLDARPRARRPSTTPVRAARRSSARRSRSARRRRRRSNGNTYAFVSWSDAGGQPPTITAPASAHRATSRSSEARRHPDADDRSPPPRRRRRAHGDHLDRSSATATPPAPLRSRWRPRPATRQRPSRTATPTAIGDGERAERRPSSRTPTPTASSYCRHWSRRPGRLLADPAYLRPPRPRRERDSITVASRRNCVAPTTTVTKPPPTAATTTRRPSRSHRHRDRQRRPRHRDRNRARADDGSSRPAPQTPVPTATASSRRRRSETSVGHDATPDPRPRSPRPPTTTPGPDGDTARRSPRCPADHHRNDHAATPAVTPRRRDPGSDRQRLRRRAVTIPAAGGALQRHRPPAPSSLAGSCADTWLGALEARVRRGRPPSPGLRPSDLQRDRDELRLRRLRALARLRDRSGSGLQRRRGRLLHELSRSDAPTRRASRPTSSPDRTYFIVVDGYATAAGGDFPVTGHAAGRERPSPPRPRRSTGACQNPDRGSAARRPFSGTTSGTSSLARHVRQTATRTGQVYQWTPATSGAATIPNLATWRVRV